MNTYITLISGYLMPPVILFIAILCLKYNVVILFSIILLLICIYYFVKTSRKVLPLMMLILFIGTSYCITTYYPMIGLDLVSYLYHFIIAILFTDLIITLRTIILVYFGAIPTGMARNLVKPHEYQQFCTYYSLSGYILQPFITRVNI